MIRWTSEKTKIILTLSDDSKLNDENTYVRRKTDVASIQSTMFSGGQVNLHFLLLVFFTVFPVLPPSLFYF